MEFRLLRPLDGQCPEVDQEPVDRLKDRHEFSNDNDWAVYQAKVFYEMFNDPNKAANILETQLAKGPSDARLHFCLAECYSRRSATARKALEHCEKGLRIEPSSDYGNTIKARVQLALQKPFDAYLSAMAALKVNSNNFEAGVYLGVVGFAIAVTERNLEEMKFSIENLRTTLSLNPGSVFLAQVIKEKEEVLTEMSGA